MHPTAAERRGLAQLERENPGYTATLTKYGVAELTPLAPEQLTRRTEVQHLGQRANVLVDLDAA